MWNIYTIQCLKDQHFTHDIGQGQLLAAGLWIAILIRFLKSRTKSSQISIIDDPLLPADNTFWSARICGLSPRCSKAGFSWLVGIRSKSKSCPPFIDWHVRNVALPYIDECRSNCPIPDSPVYYSFDGEAKVMNPMLAPDLMPL
jgi:hypothetical protein